MKTLFLVVCVVNRNMLTMTQFFLMIGFVPRPFLYTMTILIPHASPSAKRARVHNSTYAAIDDVEIRLWADQGAERSCAYTELAWIDHAARSLLRSDPRKGLPRDTPTLFQHFLSSYGTKNQHMREEGCALQ